MQQGLCNKAHPARDSGRGSIPHRLKLLSSISTFAVAFWCCPALGQSAPQYKAVDQHSVDLLSGQFDLVIPEGSVGDADGGISVGRIASGPDSLNKTNWDIQLQIPNAELNDPNAFVVIDGISKQFGFQIDSWPWQFSDPAISDGSKLETQPDGNVKYTARDGTIILFGQDRSVSCGWLGSYYCMAPIYVRKPNGMRFTYEYEFQKGITSITSSAGYRIKSINAPQGPYDPGVQGLVGIAFENVLQPCGSSCPQSHYNNQYPQQGKFYITDSANRQWMLTTTGIYYPGEVSPTITFGQYGETFTFQGIGTWSYPGTYASPNGVYQAVGRQVVGPLHPGSAYMFDPEHGGRPTLYTDGEGHQTHLEYDGSGRQYRTVKPEGDVEQRSYDARGNVTSVSHIAKDGSAAISSSASFPATCGNPGSCNKPTTTTDALGSTTEYSYDPVHGGVTMIVAPAAEAGGTRATTALSYIGLSGVDGQTVYKVSTVSTCTTGAAWPACQGSSNELRSSFTYNQNMLVASKTVASGDGGIISQTSIEYDSVGNAIRVDGPVPGNADITRYYYNIARQLVGIVGPDPDAGGPAKRKSVRFTYNNRSSLTLEEIGWVDDQSDQALSSMVVAETRATNYDAGNRRISTTLSAGGVVQAIVQYNYDAENRPLCTVVRMNAASFSGSIDPCTQGPQGASGPDRITQLAYDNNDRAIAATSGVGTAEISTDRTSFTPNGLTLSTTDGNNNVTTFLYDKYDRLSRTTFSDGSFESLSYDDNGNVVEKRVRDGKIISYSYDRLNRVVTKSRPNSVYWETNQAYVYDLLGRLTRASDSNGRVLSFGYDALGNRTSQNDNWYSWGNASFAYDPAGRRTRLAWGDGNYVTYGYRVTGETSAIHDSAGNALVTFGYDDLGRRINLTRANGTATLYGYDAASRLSSLNLSGGNQPNTIGFTHNVAGQIVTRTASNDAYAWTGHYNVDRSYGVNGLNQLTSAGGTTLGYDGRGNLTQSGAASYSYTADNQMATSPTANLAYDPLNRLFNVNAENGVNTTLLYDGDDVIAEVDQNSGTLLRRYVMGPGTDEPLIWYEGAGFTDRRWLHADERASIIAVTNDSGNAIALNSYDEFGIPGSGNLGRFQYTGQKWLPSVGLYDYKARMYSPTLGRFMQTDPAGYFDGLNWYNYTSSDPINGRDPGGLGTCPVSSGNVISVCGAREHDCKTPASYAMWEACDVANLTANPREDEPPPPGAEPHGACHTRACIQNRGVAARSRTRKISQCMQGWLTGHFPGFNWGAPTISSNDPLPGMAANTNSDLTVFVGPGQMYDRFEKSGFLFFHEMAHFPQWAGGSLTTLGYIGSALRHWGVHDDIPVEIEADAVGRFLNQAYGGEGQPCG